MLSPDYTYLSFDFETTGLDTQKDEPIQLGIVAFDHTFTIRKTYVSLIKPRKPIKELKHIVRFVTWFALEDLKDAPSIEDILPDIQEFFTEKTIIVGQNISFDLAILRKYMAFTPAHSIDTFILAKTLYHFQASYALDVLDTMLSKYKQSRSYHPQNTSTHTCQAHDALYDSFVAYNLFQQAMMRIQLLQKKYPVIWYLISKTIWKLWDILPSHADKQYFINKTLFFPPLKNVHASNKKLVIKDPIQFPEVSQQPRYVGNLGIQKLLTRIDRWKKHYIIACTHRSKYLIAQKHLEQAHISYTTLHDQVVFEPTRVHTFLQKDTCTDDELLFVIKYFSQYDLGHTTLDINRLEEYTYFNALTSIKKTTSKRVTLCTHQQLFQFAHNIDPQSHILFLDHERWYQQYSRWMKQAFDPGHMINLIEQLCYKAGISWDTTAQDFFTAYQDQLTMFIGVLWSELDKLYVWYHEQKQVIDHILDHTRFPKTQALFPSLHEATQHIIASNNNKDTQRIQKLRNKLASYLNGLCEVEKKMYHGDKRYYILHQRDIFIDYQEFLAALPPAHYHFLSNSNKEYPLLYAPQTSSVPEKQTGVDIKVMSNPKHILSHIQKQQQQKHIYILSSSKQASQQLFQDCMQSNLHKHYTILAENITWWVGKNIALAQASDRPLLRIGGYSFYLEAISKKFDFCQLIVYHLYGKMKQQIVTDLRRYAQ